MTVLDTTAEQTAGGTPVAGAPTKGSYVNTLFRQGGRWAIASSAPIPVPMK